MKSMTPERWQRVEDIFDLVVEAPEDERDRILADACAGDDALRREVTTLLNAKDQSEEHFETPPLLVAREALEIGDLLDRDHVSPGDLIGPWRVERLLGRGGMGAVYLAERADGAFDKSVALKIVKRGMDTDEIVQRFHHERRILARLEHRNIAGLLDGGRTPDGLPFFVMELASGEPIDRWCDEHTLTLRERLHLFQTVCEAVQYAHGNLVVHRDLKPGNIFVSDGAVKLLDFGIAKLVGPAADAPPHVTQAYAARLTPQYASPEQIRGLPTSTAADVYSLGVILYELLCGRAPYRLEGKTLLEMEQTVCGEEPPRPSLAVTRGKDGPPIDELARSRGLHGPESLVYALSGDIDAICMKALSKEASQRYVSAAALAEDIQRYLEGRPVRAHPPLRGYRFRKFVARNKLAVALAIITSVAVVGASIVTFVLGTAARRAGVLALEEGARATAALGFVITTLGIFDPDASGERELTGNELIGRGIENLAELEAEPGLRAFVMNALAQVAYNLGLDQRADSLYRSALAIHDSLGDRLEMAVSMLGLGEIKRRQLKADSAEYWIRRAVNIYRTSPRAPPGRLAQSLSALGFALYSNARDDSARLGEAERLYREVLSHQDAPLSILAEVYERLADVEYVTGRRDSVLAHYQEAIRRRSLEFGEDHPGNARGMWGMVNALLYYDKPAEAEELALHSRDILERAYGHYHHDVEWVNLFLGRAQRDLGKFSDAAETYRVAAMIADSVESPGYYWRGRAWYFHGQMSLLAGDTAPGVKALEASLRVFSVPEHHDRKPAATADSHLLLGEVLARQEQYREAPEHLRQAWAFFAPQGPVERSDRAAAALARIFQRIGPADSAAAWSRRLSAHPEGESH